MRVVTRRSLTERIINELTQANYRQEQISHIELTEREAQQLAGENGGQWPRGESALVSRFHGVRLVLVP